MDYALVTHPLTASFKSQLEDTLQAVPRYLTLQELRAMPWYRLISILRSLHADRLFIVLEDAGAATMLPIFYCLAAVASTREVRICHPDLTQEPVGRTRAFRAFVSLLQATLEGRRSVARCRRALRRLSRSPRLEIDQSMIPALIDLKRVLYAKANLWIGVKAGGSVGHVAGVINGLTAQGFDVEFAGTEPPLLVDRTAYFHHVPPPKTYGVPYDINLYRFHERFVSTVRGILGKREFSFVYQRLAPASYSGVELSRELKIPLVLEYNGSETWVAKNWGTQLRHADVAELAEDTSLKHAHLVVTVSDVLHDELIQRGVDPRRIVCYPNCVDPAIFDPLRFSETEIAALRQRLNIPPRAIVAGFLGTFGPWHGVEVLAEAVRRFAIDRPEWLRRHAVHFLIIGDGSGMPRAREILSHPACRGLYTLPGLVPQNDAPCYLSATDILLSPHVNNADGTRFFGSPTKLFEYMAMAKPILASDLEQIGNVLRPAIHVENLPSESPNSSERAISLLSPPGDIEGLMRGIQFLVENGRWRNVLGANARAEALQKYTWHRHVEAILNGLKALG